MTSVKGVNDMAYETKVLLMALAKIVVKADSVEEVYNALVDIANTEGVILKSFEEEKEGQKKDN